MARTLLPGAPPATASLLIRLSKQAREENLSKDGMVEDCKALALQKGLRVVSVHIDDGISGAIRDRPGFLAWLADAREMRASTLISWHVDRMTREGVNVAGLILDVIEGKDVDTGRVIRQPVRLLDTKGLDSDPGPGGDDTAFRIKFVIAAEIARAERQRMKDRNRAAHRRAVSAGRWAGGPPPYGFQVVDNPDGAGKVIAHEPAEVAFIREAADRVLSGQNISQVTRWANTQSGMRPRKAVTWGRKSLAWILTGYPVQGKVMSEVDGKAVPVVDEQGNPVTVEPVLDPEQTATLRHLLAVKDPDAAKGGRKPSRLLSGIARCSGCGSKMTVSRRGNGHVNYRCPEGYTAGVCKRPTSISAIPLETLIEQTFLRAHGRQEEHVKRIQITGAAAIADAEEKHAEALAAISASPTAENFARLQQAASDLEEARSIPSESTVTYVPTGRTIAEAWAASELEERRDLLAANYVEVRVRPGRQGKRTINPERLDIIAQPTYIFGTSLDEDYIHGLIVSA